MFAEDAATFLADDGKPCLANGHSFLALLDQPDEDLAIGGINVQSRMYLLTAATVDVKAAALANGTPITVDGQAYVVRDVAQLGDGVFSQVPISK
jgi:hypothetical protein